MITISDRNLVNILSTFMAETGNVNSGTYNQADPTAFTNAYVWLMFQYDPFWESDETAENPMVQTPGIGVYKLKMNDCTWGVEIKIEDENGGIVKTKNGWDRFPRVYLDMRKTEFESVIDDNATTSSRVMRRFLLNCLQDAEWRKKKPVFEFEGDYDDDYLGEDKSLFA